MQILYAHDVAGRRFMTTIYGQDVFIRFQVADKCFVVILIYTYNGRNVCSTLSVKEKVWLLQ